MKERKKDHLARRTKESELRKFEKRNDTRRSKLEQFFVKKRESKNVDKGM